MFSICKQFRSSFSYSTSTKGYPKVVELFTPQSLKETITKLNLKVEPSHLDTYLNEVNKYLGDYQQLSAFPDNLPPVRYPRSKPQKPNPKQNQHNAWAHKIKVTGAPYGKLKGKTVTLKDNIMLAECPMMNGTQVLKDYIPEVDATIVNRILDAGATIVGKSHCENLCFSGSSHTCAFGPVLNPHNKEYMAGGSSSGTTCLVALKECDMGIGGDQGGSIRLPSSWSGTYGMKPTWGLVPHTGILGMDASLDHTGPITHNVYDNTLLLEAIAGPDQIDPRQAIPLGTDFRYSQNLFNGDIKNLKIGILKEGFGSTSHPEGSLQDKKVLAAVHQLGKLGAQVEEVSIPMHKQGPTIFFAVIHEGFLQTMKMNASCSKGLSVPSFIEHFSAWKNQSDLPHTVKLSLLVSEYISSKYGSVFYAKGQNLTRQLSEEYTKVLRKYDLLACPTTPFPATKIPPSETPLEQWIAASFGMLNNTCPFDITGHPAMNVPCGMIDGRPVGLMLVSRHWGEDVIYKAAFAYEQSVNWEKK